MTDPALWESNSLLGTGADCMALNLLQWLGAAALLRLVSFGIGVEPPVLDPKGLAEVEPILEAAERDTLNFPLFGFTGMDQRERVPRRLERVETLMGSCARTGGVDPFADALLRSLRILHAPAARLAGPTLPISWGVT
jgi:hypothetical protein